jgi:crotonobetainyl-CoA:carnitine CoA-transferase CaiB-like acyl-CoA transferase
MGRPLEGMLVVSVEQAVAAPLCTCRLADAGARVTKIERLEGDLRAAMTVPPTARAAISYGSTAARNPSFLISKTPMTMTCSRG